jgi:hypothetical protein
MLAEAWQVKYNEGAKAKRYEYPVRYPIAKARGL